MNYLVSKTTKQHFDARKFSPEDANDEDLVRVHASPAGWIKRVGREWPLPEGALADVVFRDGAIAKRVTHGATGTCSRGEPYRITFDPSPRDVNPIIAYRPVLSDDQTPRDRDETPCGDVCASENCSASTPGAKHSTECRFEHFMSYSGNSNTPECKDMLRLVRNLRTSCTDERPCIPCFTDNGPCEDEPEMPVVGDKYTHRNGCVYRVTGFANVHTDRPDKYPVSVIYQGATNGKVWCRPLKDWARSFVPDREVEAIAQVLNSYHVTAAAEPVRSPSELRGLARALYREGYRKVKSRSDEKG